MDVAKKKRTWGIVLLVGPAALLIVTFILYALTNFLLGATGSNTNVLINILLFVVGVISVISFLPGLIIGIILLATAQSHAVSAPVDDHKRPNGYATASLVLGIVSLVTWFFGIVPAVLAIVFGAIARRNPTTTNRGMATAGLTMGIIGAALTVLIFVFSFAIGVSDSYNSRNDSLYDNRSYLD